MTEWNIGDSRPPLPPRRPPPTPPGVRTDDPSVEPLYEEVNPTSNPSGYSCLHRDERSSQYHDDGFTYEGSSDTYISPPTIQGVVSEYDNTTTQVEGYTNEHVRYPGQTRSDAVPLSYDYSNDYWSERTLNDLTKKIDRFQRNPKAFLDAFESTRDEMRTDEEMFIIVHLLKKNESNSPVLNGNLEQLALLACCSSPHVVKRALDALLNEIFLSISDFSRIRCRNIMQAENIIRQSFHESLQVDHVKAKCQRMTTYAWLITFVLLKCSKEECAQIAREIEAFNDKTLDILLNESIERNTFRYGIHLARETIRRIVLLSRRKDPKESLHRSIKRCANILNSRLDEKEVMTLGKALNDEGSWLNVHVCLVFLQDLPKLHQFQDNLKPIILIQMLIQDYRYRDRNIASRLKRAMKIPDTEIWRFEILVYHVLLRLIETSANDSGDKQDLFHYAVKQCLKHRENKNPTQLYSMIIKNLQIRKHFFNFLAITEQVLMGKQGCGGVFTTWSESKSKTTRNPLVMENLEKICKRVIFRTPTICFEQLITCICNGDEQSFIEDLAILRLSSKYKDKVLEILPKLDVRGGRQRVSTYDALMSGKKCVLKLYRHSKEEILKATDTPKTDPLRKEIEIVKVLNALAEPCPNLVQLLGSSIEAPMHMIIERGFKGDLLTFLNKHLKVTEARSLVHIALDICNAMIFIHGQNIIHRDLRAKNCFVFMRDGKVLTKIGDFHLAAIAYPGPRSPTGASFKYRNSLKTSMINTDSFSRFAVAWMAVETLQFGEFSTASDVWSYGVLLFEIFTFGCQPYVNMPSGLSLNSDEDVREYVTKGNRLELHPRIPESIQVLIQLTMVDADHRPKFSQLRDNLTGMTFEDETTDSAYFEVSHDNGNSSSDIISRQIGAVIGGCTANGCFGECLNATDVAVSLNVDDTHFIKEFIPATSSDILQLSGLECPSLATITDKIFHDEKVELITEVGDLGSLKEFTNAYGCSPENAKRYLLQIGEAVSFLHLRRFIHRNLCANSVFVYLNGNAKLACFGRVRKLKPNADDQSLIIPIHLPMPADSLRWSSLEVITDGEYSKASDMWAFGVMIWEMFSLIDKERDGSNEEIKPYQQFTSKEQILSYLQKEKRLVKPKTCPDWLYEMMLTCWENNTHDRAKAEDIVQCINDNIPKDDHPF